MNNPDINEEKIEKTEMLEDTNHEEYDKHRVHQHTPLRLLGAKKGTVQFMTV